MQAVVYWSEATKSFFEERLKPVITTSTQQQQHRASRLNVTFDAPTCGIEWSVRHADIVRMSANVAASYPLHFVAQPRERPPVRSATHEHLRRKRNTSHQAKEASKDADDDGVDISKNWQWFTAATIAQEQYIFLRSLDGHVALGSTMEAHMRPHNMDASSSRVPQQTSGSIVTPPTAIVATGTAPATGSTRKKTFKKVPVKRSRQEMEESHDASTYATSSRTEH